jgi:hypothetical protein
MISLPTLYAIGYHTDGVLTPLCVIKTHDWNRVYSVLIRLYGCVSSSYGMGLSHDIRIHLERADADDELRRSRWNVRATMLNTLSLYTTTIGTFYVERIEM